MVNDPKFFDDLARGMIICLIVVVIGAIILWEIGKYFWQHLSLSWQ